jgi:hypothetical protein
VFLAEVGEGRTRGRGPAVLFWVATFGGNRTVPCSGLRIRASARELTPTPTRRSTTPLPAEKGSHYCGRVRMIGLVRKNAEAAAKVAAPGASPHFRPNRATAPPRSVANVIGL